jgi:hypothetical protein
MLYSPYSTRAPYNFHATVIVCRDLHSEMLGGLRYAHRTYLRNISLHPPLLDYGSFTFPVALVETVLRQMLQALTDSLGQWCSRKGTAAMQTPRA